MDPIKININVTLDASENLLAAIQTITGNNPQSPLAKPKQPAKPETKPAPQPETKPAPEPEVKEESDDDMPDEIANPTKGTSDEELRALIKEIRTATSPAAVRELFNEFGIRTSIECPMERRPELVARLKKLAA